MSSLHHRAIIRGRNDNDLFWRRTSDIGFAWGTKWEDEPRVTDVVKEFHEHYDIVTVDTRDAG